MDHGDNMIEGAAKNIEIIEHINPEEFVEGNGLVINEVNEEASSALEVQLEEVIENAIEVDGLTEINPQPSSPSENGDLENLPNQRSSEEE